MIPVMSEKPNYTTAKFFEQALNDESEYMAAHTRVKSYRTVDARLDGGLSDKSLTNHNTHNTSTNLSPKPGKVPEQMFN